MTVDDLRCCVDKVIVVDGYRFVRDDRTGYWRCSKLRERLHRYIWKKHHGEIPDGFHVHHIDGDRRNNHISNLTLMPHSRHAAYHMEIRELDPAYRAWRTKNMEAKVRPAAIAWHKSAAGRRWHSKHAKKVAKTRRPERLVCEQCGKAFEAWNTGTNRFCSNRCKAAWRRASGLDDEKRTCELCGSEFRANKYSRQRFCSKTCSNRAVPRLPQIRAV